MPRINMPPGFLKYYGEEELKTLLISQPPASYFNPEKLKQVVSLAKNLIDSLPPSPRGLLEIIDDAQYGQPHSSQLSSEDSLFDEWLEEGFHIVEPEEPYSPHLSNPREDYQWENDYSSKPEVWHINPIVVMRIGEEAIVGQGHNRTVLALDTYLGGKLIRLLLQYWGYSPSLTLPRVILPAVEISTPEDFYYLLCMRYPQIFGLNKKDLEFPENWDYSEPTPQHDPLARITGTEVEILQYMRGPKRERINDPSAWKDYFNKRLEFLQQLAEEQEFSTILNYRNRMEEYLEKLFG